MTASVARFVALTFAAGMVFACKVSTQLPMTHQTVELSMPADQLVCHVRQVAASQQLSFHYGTFDKPNGTAATFRLIGNGFEIVLFNPEEPTTFDLEVYDMSKGEARERAHDAYRKFAALLTSQPSEECVPTQTPR